MVVSRLMATNPKMNPSLSLHRRGAFCDPSLRQNLACHMAGTRRKNPVNTRRLDGSYLVLPHGSDGTDKGLASPSCSAYYLRPGSRTRYGGSLPSIGAAVADLLISVPSTKYKGPRYTATGINYTFTD
ncbi:hypothetical protein V8C42DRAFT_310027 [Trichoderma barbatum]